MFLNAEMAIFRQFICFWSVCRSAELIAVIAIGLTLILFLHTNNLNTRLKEMQDRLSGPASDETAINIINTNSIINTEYSLKNNGRLKFIISIIKFNYYNILL